MSESRRTRAGNIAVDNMIGCERQKAEIRRRVLHEIRPAHVFDVFAGEGKIYDAVWRDAAEYIGCDERWLPDAPGRRIVGDSYEILRAVDLQPWNVFDIDCYGEPWRALLILADRRRWAPGERGAITCTNSTLRQKFGFASHAAVAAIGLPDRNLKHTTVDERDAMRDLAFARWAARAGVRIEQLRMARFTARSGMEYLALTFRGLEPTPMPVTAEAAGLGGAGPAAPTPADPASRRPRRSGTHPRSARR